MLRPMLLALGLIVLATSAQSADAQLFGRRSVVEEIRYPQLTRTYLRYRLGGTLTNRYVVNDDYSWLRLYLYLNAANQPPVVSSSDYSTLLLYLAALRGNSNPDLSALLGGHSHSHADDETTRQLLIALLLHVLRENDGCQVPTPAPSPDPASF